MPKRAVHSLLTWGGLAVSVLFAYLAVRNVQFSEVWHGLRTCNYWWLGPALLIFVFAIFTKAVRWRYLFAPETRPDLGPVVSALLVGYFFNNILPARAGEVARVISLKQRAGTSRAEAGGTVVAERVYDVLVLLALLFIAVPWLPHVTWLHTAVVLAAVAAGGALIAVVSLAVFGAGAVHFALKPLAWVPRIPTERVLAFGEDLAQGLVGFRHPRIVLGAVFWTTLSWIAMAATTWCVMLGFGLHLSIVAALLLVIATNLAMILPSSPSGVGVFEYAATEALHAYHVGHSRALTCALVIHVLNFVPLIIAGLWVLRFSFRGRGEEPGVLSSEPA